MTEDDSEVNESASYVMRSRNRHLIVNELSDNPNIPSAIGRKHDIDTSNVSRSMARLKAHGIVELAVSEEVTKGRIYRLTDYGETVAEVIPDEVN